nr:transcriptional regulatory protein SIN3-like [Setaria viridis]TKW08255.1 hypothetical protein SEVIR_6G017400v2 [Setaria viridis]
MGYTGGLKREREEEHGTPAPPVTSRPRVDPPTPAPPVRVIRPLAPPSAEACRFFDFLQREFADKPHKIVEFQAILLDYYYMSIDIAGVVDRLQVVFQGYPNLVRAFNTLLLMGYALKQDDQQGGGGAGDA